jgi:hypothetical protein
MDQPLDAGCGASLRDMAGALAMDGLVGLLAALKRDAGGVDHRVAALDGGRHRGGHPEIGLQQVDLADIAERLDRIGRPDPPDGDADQVTLAG